MTTITKNDRREIGKLLKFMRLVREGASQLDAYSDVYGEVIFHDKEVERDALAAKPDAGSKL